MIRPDQAALLAVAAVGYSRTNDQRLCSAPESGMVSDTMRETHAQVDAASSPRLNGRTGLRNSAKQKALDDFAARAERIVR